MTAGQLSLPKKWQPSPYAAIAWEPVPQNGSTQIPGFCRCVWFVCSTVCGCLRVFMPSQSSCVYACAYVARPNILPIGISCATLCCWGRTKVIRAATVLFAWMLYCLPKTLLLSPAMSSMSGFLYPSPCVGRCGVCVLVHVHHPVRVVRPCHTAYVRVCVCVRVYLLP